jgi:TPR repeat protein
MAEVYIAAAPGEESQALGLSEALGLLGFSAASGTPGEGDIAKLVEESKAVIVLWSKAAAGAPWLTALAVLGQERKKLVHAERETGSTPAPFQAAPRIDLAVRDRTKFMVRFEALTKEIDKLAAANADPNAMPDAITKARAALSKVPTQPGAPQWRTLGVFAGGVLALFIVGFGTGRVINMVRTGTPLFVATPSADAAPTSAPITPESDAITLADLQRQPWREIALGIDEEAATRIKADAQRGDALAQTLACLAHMAGAEGFLPSPAAAREQCDAAAAQENPAGLYFSWVLRRDAPHAGIDEATARGRLQRAAQLGWTPAQIDYGLSMPADRESQAEAGRLFLAAAEAGDPRGQFQYAKWLRDSVAGPRDPVAAIPYLDRAATSGQLEAAHMLATLYRDGIGVPRNEGRAKALYEQAARGHYPPSMFNLADMIRGGTPEDRARAVTLFQELACMRDERQIQPMAMARLRALQATASCG